MMNEKTMGKRELKNQLHRQKLLDACAKLISEKGIASVTVRGVTETAGLSIGTFYYHFKDKDDLLFSFVLSDFQAQDFHAPLSDPAGRQIELYMRLIEAYQKTGIDFMKQFYSTSNKALSTYMEETDGGYKEGSIMALSLEDLQMAQGEGYIRKEESVTDICRNICTIVKGTVFEWCLNDGKMDIETTLTRLIRSYMFRYVAQECDQL